MRHHGFDRVRVTRRHGKTLVLVAVSIVAICGIAGLVVDGGMAMGERRHAQNAADAAALAGAIDLYKSKSATIATNTAFLYASRNGYSSDGSTNNVTVNIPPTYGPQVGNNRAVEVIATRNVGTSFIKILYPNAVSVTARSVAEMYKDATFLLLDPTMNHALTLSGSASINVESGSVAVNSSSSSAVVGSSTVQLTAEPIDITGNYTLSGSAQLNGTVNTGATPTADPLSSLPAVSSSDLTLRSSGDVSFSGGTGTLQPGLYMGKITLSSSASVTLQPGIYYVAGDFTLSGSASITANNVMIYAVGKFTVSGTGAVVMTPPTSGMYKGITLFKDRTSTKTDVTLSGGSNMQISGTLYAAPSPITISGSSGVASFGSRIIADTATVSGSGTIKLSGTGDQQHVYLSE